MSGRNKPTDKIGWAKCVAAALAFHAALLSLPLSFSKVSQNGKERLIGVVLVREETPAAAPFLKARKPGTARPPSLQGVRTEPPAAKQTPAPANQAAGQVEKNREPVSNGAGNVLDAHIASRVSPGPPQGGGAAIAGAETAGGKVGTGGGGGGNGSGIAGRGTGTGTGSGGGGPVEARFSDADGPRFVHHEPPEYPPAARRQGREGKVVLMITIDEMGKPIRVDVVEATDRSFARSAMEALKRSTFLPAKRNGVPVVSRATIPVRFIVEQ